jgi:hypothetical protein
MSVRFSVLVSTTACPNYGLPKVARRTSQGQASLLTTGRSIKTTKTTQGLPETRHGRLRSTGRTWEAGSQRWPSQEHTRHWTCIHTFPFHLRTYNPCWIETTGPFVTRNIVWRSKRRVDSACTTSTLKTVWTHNKLFLNNAFAPRSTAQDI